MKIKSTFPFNTQKFPFFYGWIVMMAGTVGVIFSIPGQTMGVSAFTNHLIDALQLSRDNLALAYMFGTMASSFLLTKAGKLWDKHGARIIGGGAAITLAVFLLLGSVSDKISIALAKVTGISVGMFSFAIIMLVFFGIRFSGQGVITMVSRNVTMKWFDRRRGLANGISSSVVSYGFAVAPIFLIFLINRFTWSGAWQVMALLMLAFVMFFTIFVRDTPEDCGTIPDGKIIPLKQNNATGFENRKQYTLKEAKKTWVFWIYALTLSFYSFYVTGMTFHIQSLFETNGYNGKEAFEIFPKIAYISISVSIIANVISDYIRLQYLLFVMLSGAFCSSLGLVILEHSWAVPMLIIGNGVMGGIFVVLIAVAWPRFFGRKNLGAISGFSGSILVIASSISPLLFSYSLSWLGSYSYVGWIAIGLTSTLLLLAMKAKNPQLNP